jgi:general secretion pathway protein J
MKQKAAPHSRSNAGFTLIEALIAMALMGLILASLATITTQWLPSWNRGFVRVQNNELVSIAMDRVTADLGAAEFVTPNSRTRFPLFEGAELAVTFVRVAIAPNAKPGLEVVRISESADQNGRILVRSRAPFAPFGVGPVTSAQLRFTDPVILLRAPYRVSFDYAGADGLWKNTWRGATELPAAVRITIRDAASERVLAVSAAAKIHVDTPAVIPCVPGDNACDEQVAPVSGPDQSGNQAQQGRAMR